VESCLYEGWVGHRRQGRVRHRFRLRLCMLYLDLAELDRVFHGRWLWSTRRPALVRFRREDHFGDPRVPLDQAVRDLVEQRSGRRPAGPIRVLTHPRHLGYVFNPVSLHYCFAPGGRRLDAVVAEVTNTPWNERHCYVLSRPEGDPGEGALRAGAPKVLHVSQFLGMDLAHRFAFHPPGARLVARIEDRAPDGTRSFEASLVLVRREVDGRALASALVRHPLMTARVTGAIYWHALRLHRKGAPFHPHPRSQGRPQEVAS
jgi:uncharacterized protein